MKNDFRITTELTFSVKYWQKGAMKYLCRGRMSEKNLL